MRIAAGALGVLGLLATSGVATANVVSYQCATKDADTDAQGLSVPGDIFQLQVDTGSPRSISMNGVWARTLVDGVEDIPYFGNSDPSRPPQRIMQQSVTVLGSNVNFGYIQWSDGSQKASMWMMDMKRGLLGYAIPDRFVVLAFCARSPADALKKREDALNAPQVLPPLPQVPTRTYPTPEQLRRWGPRQAP